MSDTHVRQAPTLEMLHTRRAEILNLAEQYGAFNVRIFGSVARREATSDSDVDFLVDFRPGTSIWDVVALWRQLGELLQCEVNVIGQEAPDDPFMQAALRDA